MEELATSAHEEELAGELERLWLEGRQRAVEILAAQKTQLDEAELRLQAHVQLISEQLAAEAEEHAGEHSAELERLREDLRKQQLEAERAQEATTLELEQWSERLREKQEELEHRQEQLQADAQAVMEDRRKLADAVAQHEHSLEQLAENRKQLEDEQSQLRAAQGEVALARSELDEARAQLEHDRASLAEQQSEQAVAAGEERERLRLKCEELSALHAETQQALAAQLEKNNAQAAQLETLRAAAKQQEPVTAQLAEAQAKLADLASAHETLRGERDALATGLQEQQAAAETRSRALKERIESLEADLVKARADAPDQKALASAKAESVAQLEAAKRDAAEAIARAGELEKRLAAAEAAAAEAEAEAAAANAPAPDDQHVQDLQRRFELAVDDVRGLKRRNAELEDQIAALKAEARGPANAGGGQDWESMKQRMLAELNADTDTSQNRKEEKVSIENTIRITDNIVGQKDQEITELKQLLAQQSENIGAMAVGAAAVEQMFDQDEAIRQERERLVQAQEEWRQKLRQAEVDISLERARLARERAEMEEKLRVFESERSQLQSPSHDHGHAKGAKPARGRWLERLGLKEPDK